MGVKQGESRRPDLGDVISGGLLSLFRADVWAGVDPSTRGSAIGVNAR